MAASFSPNSCCRSPRSLGMVIVEPARLAEPGRRGSALSIHLHVGAREAVADGAKAGRDLRERGKRGHVVNICGGSC